MPSFWREKKKTREGKEGEESRRGNHFTHAKEKNKKTF